MGHLKFKLPTKGPRRRRLDSRRTRLTKPGDPDADPPIESQLPPPLGQVSWWLPSFSELLAFIVIVSVFAILIAAAIWPGSHFELPKGFFDKPSEVIEPTR